MLGHQLASPVARGLWERENISKTELHGMGNRYVHALTSGTCEGLIRRVFEDLIKARPSKVILH